MDSKAKPDRFILFQLDGQLYGQGPKLGPAWMAFDTIEDARMYALLAGEVFPGEPLNFDNPASYARRGLLNHRDTVQKLGLVRRWVG